MPTVGCTLWSLAVRTTVFDSWKASPAEEWVRTCAHRPVKWWSPRLFVCVRASVCSCGDSKIDREIFWQENELKSTFYDFSISSLSTRSSSVPVLGAEFGQPSPKEQDENECAREGSWRFLWFKGANLFAFKNVRELIAKETENAGTSLRKGWTLDKMKSVDRWALNFLLKVYHQKKETFYSITSVIIIMAASFQFTMTTVWPNNHLWKKEKKWIRNSWKPTNVVTWNRSNFRLRIKQRKLVESNICLFFNSTIEIGLQGSNI